MTQTREGGASQPATGHAEDIFEQAGLRLGRFAGQARQRFQQAAQAFRAQANETVHASQQKNGTRAGDNTGGRPSATERSEELIDLFGQRVNRWVTVNGLQARRALALLQENAEDMWVEAQSQYAAWKSGRAQAEEERH
jgi:hypothetical protein